MIDKLFNMNKRRVVTKKREVKRQDKEKKMMIEYLQGKPPRSLSKGYRLPIN